MPGIRDGLHASTFAVTAWSFAAGRLAPGHEVVQLGHELVDLDSSVIDADFRDLESLHRHHLGQAGEADPEYRPEPANS